MVVVYYVVFFFPVVLHLDSSGNIAIVRIRSTTPVRLLHGLILLPCGISGKMTATLDLITIIAMLVASFYRFAALPIFCSSSLPNCHEPLTFDTLPSKPFLGYVTSLLSPLIALLVAGEVEDCSMVDRILLGYHNSLILLMHLYIW